MSVAMDIIDTFISNRKFVRVSLNQVKSYSYGLSKDIMKRSGRPSSIVYIERGGMVVARLLSDMLGVKNVSGINANYYTGINERSAKVSIGEMPRLAKLGGYVLIVDDVADTGKTLQAVSNAMGRSKKFDIMTCTLFYKSRSIVKPDFYAREISNEKWIIFEYEENEFRKKLK